MELFYEYIDKQKKPLQKERLRELFHWMQENFPDLEPTMAWNQPMYTHHGTFIIGFSCADKHLSVSPEAYTLDRFSSAIKKSGYSQTKNIFRINWLQEIDYPLLRELIAFNIEDKADFKKFWR